LDFIRAHISDEEVEEFITLFHANNPLAGNEDVFQLVNGSTQRVEDMFSEGGCGNGAIHNILEIFNLVSNEVNRDTVRVELIWYEYGQIMHKCYEWVSKSFKGYQQPWPDFMKFIASEPWKKYEAMKFYTYVE
jgi:hypothetical protein